MFQVVFAVISNQETCSFPLSFVETERITACYDNCLVIYTNIFLRAVREDNDV